MQNLGIPRWDGMATVEGCGINTCREDRGGLGSIQGPTVVESFAEKPPKVWPGFIAWAGLAAHSPYTDILASALSFLLSSLPFPPPPLTPTTTILGV